MPAVQVLLRNGGALPNGRFILDVDDQDTICNLKFKLQEKSDVNSDSMKIVFCGRQLDGSTPLKSLCLGPQTNLVVLIESERRVVDENSAVCPASESPRRTIYEYSSFFVFCKRCDQLQNGKLRAHCIDCKSTSIVFLDEPTGWDDVMGRSKLKVECKECCWETAACVCFKCVECGEESTPLTHVKRNVDNSACVICDESGHECSIVLNCLHGCCVSCFTTYCHQMLSQQNFLTVPTVGMTIPCPVFQCQSYVKDVHHFYLLGVDAYRTYQKTATELFLMKQSERIVCPSQTCSAAFILLEEDNGEVSVNGPPMILCPECLRLFCRWCQTSGECKCDDQMQKASQQTINRTSKACPTCGTPTERNGGCAHIHCTQCKNDWCFVCGAQWTDECQWDHWFS